MSNQQDPKKQDSKKQDPKNVENEPQAADEIASEDLDQVVGGAAFTPPDLPPTSDTPFIWQKIT